MSSIKGPPSADKQLRAPPGMRIGIVHARWNQEVIEALVSGTLQSLSDVGVQPHQVMIESVPGSWELPFATMRMIEKYNVSAVIAIGCVIKGSTMHFEYICENCFQGLMRVSLDSKKPVILGVLSTLTEDQALERAGIGRNGKPGHNHGLDWGRAAVEMVIKNQDA
ncbi:unnamed protein product [Malassezia sympodialis ATCC 42132]|uniref:6,7-dimethyl-8-ribityllumazine synthase n=1 Tax=Malassezia sympodialis (strain ATCC 42132) TaxID=1230383 RepID=M5ECU4_MALS4|nr:uncharacterized protein MSY001_3416 [Malassezia sympodialis ATCC 42132]CCV00710.1 unnamed protein product [Malassezia sympodialis ATCC 42132]SHO77566.1 Similar to S.cerevisiae protein RIB4 (Lumazine synthase (DMRL synthase)) [Malassezia sympodialis ATCC 42132]|eukprot:XP_018741889.1 uncharacterized protein MSY001_3416 [Malassezia sympodialis ATCC 42132]